MQLNLRTGLLNPLSESFVSPGRMSDEESVRRFEFLFKIQSNTILALSDNNALNQARIEHMDPIIQGHFETVNQQIIENNEMVKKIKESNLKVGMNVKTQLVQRLRNAVEDLKIMSMELVYVKENQRGVDADKNQMSEILDRNKILVYSLENKTNTKLAIPNETHELFAEKLQQKLKMLKVLSRDLSGAVNFDISDLERHDELSWNEIFELLSQAVFVLQALTKQSSELRLMSKTMCRLATGRMHGFDNSEIQYSESENNIREINKLIDNLRGV